MHNGHSDCQDEVGIRVIEQFDTPSSASPLDACYHGLPPQQGPGPGTFAVSLK